MHKLSNGKTFRTAQERAELVAKFGESGASIQDFCAQEGLAPSSLHTWLRKAEVSQKGVKRGGFKAVKTPEPLAGFVALDRVSLAKSGVELEVKFPDGTVARIRGGRLMLELGGAARIFAYGKPVDMRKSYDGLIALTKFALEEDPLSGNLYVFINRRGTHLKILKWDRTGYCLFAKRLERGRFTFPLEDGKQELEVQRLRLILDGLDLGRKKANTLIIMHDA